MESCIGCKHFSNNKFMECLKYDMEMMNGYKMDGTIKIRKCKESDIYKETIGDKHGT